MRLFFFYFIHFSKNSFIFKKDYLDESIFLANNKYLKVQTFDKIF